MTTSKETYLTRSRPLLPQQLRPLGPVNCADRATKITLGFANQRGVRETYKTIILVFGTHLSNFFVRAHQSPHRGVIQYLLIYRVRPVGCRWLAKVTPGVAEYVYQKCIILRVMQCVFFQCAIFLCILRSCKWLHLVFASS